MYIILFTTTINKHTSHLTQGYSSEYLTEDSQVLLMQTMDSMVSLLQDLVSNGLDRDDVPAQVCTLCFVLYVCCI